MENHEMKQRQDENTKKQALENYISQFKTKNQVIAEMHHLNTFQYHLNIKLWHLENAEADNVENDHLVKEVEENHLDNT